MSETAADPTPTNEHLVMLAEMGREDQVAAAFRALHPADIAEVLDALEEDDLRARLFDHLDTEQAAFVLAQLDDEAREPLLAVLPEPRLRAIVQMLESDDAADLLADLPRARVERVLQSIPSHLSADVRDLMQYDEESAGGIMQREFVALDRHMTVEQAIGAVRDRAAERLDLHNVFVVDENQRLIGVLPIRLLILASPRATLGALMNPNPIAAHTAMDQEEVASLFKKYDLVSLPVVDAAGRMVGRITVDDVVDVIEEEASEDIYRLAGMSEASPHGGALHSVRQRLPWLLLNLCTCLVSASVVALFEGTISRLAIAAAFMTMVAATGGNAGVQTLAVIVRGLALGEVTLINARRVILRELGTGLMNGIALGAVAALVALAWKGVPMIGVVIGLAITLNLVLAALIGAVVPLGLKWVGVDPAIASSVLLTAFTDSFGFFLFLGLLTLFQHLQLLG
jgi:magnesium transporter